MLAVVSSLFRSFIILQTGVVMDNHPPGRNFGDVLVAPLATYKVGDSVIAQFVAANPRVGSCAMFVLEGSR